MNKLILIISLFLVSSTTFSQISIRKENTKVSKRPPQYDSLRNNFTHYNSESLYDQKQYIGQELLFTPLTDKQKKMRLSTMVVSKYLFLTERIKETKLDHKPFAKSNMGIVLASYPEKYKQQEEQYLKKYNIETNIYHSYIVNYKEMLRDSDRTPKIINDYKKLENKSFLVLDVFGGYDVESKQVISPIGNQNITYLFYMLQDEMKDTVYLRLNRSFDNSEGKFIVQGFYDKNKEYYVGNSFVYRDVIHREYTIKKDRKDDNNYAKIINSDLVDAQHKEYYSTYEQNDRNQHLRDINTNEIVDRVNLSTWECVDLTLIISEDEYRLYYIMKNNESTEIKIPAGKLEKYGFVFKKTYEMEMKAKQLKVDELNKLQGEKEAKYKAFLMQKKQDLISKYGLKNGTKIFDGEVELGMTKEMCLEAWGSTNSKLTNNLIEIWIYSYGNSLSFKDDVLIQIVSL